MRDGVELESYAGDEAVTHGRRLPGDLVRVLDRQRLSVGDIDLFAVAAGPGSFTGLRIGIATMQGLALAGGKRLIGVSALDALHHASLLPLGAPKPGEGGLPPKGAVATWIDAQRGEVFSALYQDGAVIDGPSVEKPDEVLARWGSRADRSESIAFVGGGASRYADLIRPAWPLATVQTDEPMLALSVAQLGERQARGGDEALPDAVRPIYVRRPDVDLARSRQAPATR